MIISGVITLRDPIEASYPFMESILSLLPMVDEFLINDGGSTDGSLQYLERLAKIFPKIKLYHVPDHPGLFWDCIDEVLNFLAKEAKGEWIVEDQCDEMFDEKTLFDYRKQIETVSAQGFNGIRQKRRDVFQLQTVDPIAYQVVRAVRNLPNLVSHEGGDCYCIGEYSARKGFTSHNCPPEFDSDIELYHILDTYQLSYKRKAKRHALYLSTVSQDRLDRWDLYKDREDCSFYYHKKGSPVLDYIPALSKDLGGEQYEVREELFNIEWLNNTTGLRYDII
jgi:glycosyltransferase involved in cell wall biosynthesis